MILLPSFLVCAEMLHCYTAVYNSPLVAARVSKPLLLFLRGCANGNIVDTRHNDPLPNHLPFNKVHVLTSTL